ncbi:MAG: hypothetical protein H6832_07335 [Planctomycetes bacterium]|nr:hypothetical protein [Planctomycetota bacterium]MCB9918200.1 hypothetical protein [Planctomycetota bacterium]
MRGVLRLASRRLVHAWKQNLILCFALALAFFVPLASTLVSKGFETKLRTRSERVPLVLGARGNRFDLTLAVLSHRDLALPPLERHEADELAKDGRAYVIPVGRRFRARGTPIVATTPDYFEVMGSSVARGTLPIQLGDCVLGAHVASRLALDVGARVFSDPTELYDLSKPPALEMLVTGVLRENGTADDDAVFVDIKTDWLLAGLFHGHEDARAIDEKLVMSEQDGERVLSKAVLEYQKVTDDNRDAFHIHGDPSKLPISAAIVVPKDDKQRTILEARLQTSRTLQLLKPADVIEELLDYVFGIKALVDGLALLIGISTVLLVGLVLSLTLRLRASETRSLQRIGVARGTIVRLWCLEHGALVVAALALAVLATWSVLSWIPTVWAL